MMQSSCLWTTTPICWHCCVSSCGAQDMVISELPKACLLYTSYIPLSAYEVANWDKATHTVTYGTRSFNWGLLAFTLALGAVLFALAWRKVQDEEV